jgi:iron complex transport system substrate-binding protein
VIRRVVLQLAFAAATAGAAVPVQAAPRIASINVCTDQLVMALADPAQIAGLSPYARDPESSWLAERAKAFRRLSGEAEDVLMLRPDVVVAAPFTRRATRAMLKRQAVRVVEFPVAQSLDDVRNNLRLMGEVAGHPERASAEIARFDAALQRARAAAARQPLRVLAVSRRGWITGQHSLLGALLAAVGLDNVADQLGVAAGGYQPLEAIIRLKPDVIVVSDEGRAAEDQGQAFVLHPALERLYPPDKRIVIPDRLTVCDGPSLTEALDRLSMALARSGRP